MSELKKVIKILKSCMESNCNECPIKDSDDCPAFTEVPYNWLLKAIHCLEDYGMLLEDYSVIMNKMKGEESNEEKHNDM